MKTMANKVALNLAELLSSPERDFLICNGADGQVPVSNLLGKTVGLYFCASGSDLCKNFTAKLEQVYQKLGSTQSNKFEVVCVCTDESEDYSKMPWLAIPFSDSETRDRLTLRFMVSKLPALVILDPRGKVVTEKGTEVVSDYGEDGFPFTFQKIRFLKREAKQNQTLSSVFSSSNFLISSVLTRELENKTVALYFSKHSDENCQRFYPLLLETYNELKEKENFEVVLIPQDESESEFREGFEAMPWLALPFKDKSESEKLKRYFEIQTFPALVIIGPNGKTLVPNAVEFIKAYGSRAYPFTLEKLSKLAAPSRRQRAAPTVHEEEDFTSANDGRTVSMETQHPPCYTYQPQQTFYDAPSVQFICHYQAAPVRYNSQMAGPQQKTSQEACKNLLKYGVCKYAQFCKFSHPWDQHIGVFPRRPRGLPCPDYRKTSFCRYGRECLFDHPEGARVRDLRHLKFNDRGLPLYSDKQKCESILSGQDCVYHAYCLLDHS